MTADLSLLSRRFMEAVRDRELDWLEEHLGAEFTLTTGRPGTPVRGREEWLAVTGGRYVIEEFAFDDLDVLEYGDVGVVRSRYRQRGSMDGADRSQAFLMTDVWVQRDGRMQLVTRHVSPLPASDPAGV
jgi:ketosteroid isomerase-like protein